MDISIRCICPEKDGAVRHPDGDTVQLRDELGFRDLAVYLKTVQLHAGDPAEMLASMTERHLYVGINAWTVTDAKGYAVAPDREAVETYLIPQMDVAMQIAEAADELYMPVILPLVTKGTASWRTTPTAPSTSQSPSGGSKLPKRSKPSSTTSSLMDVTGPMPASPGVGSSSLPS